MSERQIEGLAFSVEGLLRDADEIAGWGAGNEATGVRWAAVEIVRLRTALAEARKVIEPFAEASRGFDNITEHFGGGHRPDDYKPRTEFTHGHLRAARKWYDANSAKEAT